MAGNTLIITGSSRGIGAATARLAGSRGWAVAVNYVRDAGAADSVVGEIRAGGGHACAIQGDVGSEEDILRLFETAEKELGPIRGLVNNAAVTGGLGRADAVTTPQLDHLFRVNITGTLLCSREAIKRMSTKHGGAGGAMVNISSLAARTGSGGEWVHYAASKGAINTFTVGLARELATEGIRVNAVAPGLVETEIHASVGAPDRPWRMAPSIPMQRPGKPGEIAEAVVWLLSPAASYVTGTILEVGGGR